MRAPDLEGNNCRVWKIRKPDRRGPRWQPDWEASLANYILHCPWAHPFWSWYAIAGVHLRAIPGVPPPKLHFGGAGYEIDILSLNPDYVPDISGLEADTGYLRYLTPPDLVHQVTGKLTDEQFQGIVQEVIVTIVEGRASPDVDYREWWRQAIDQTVAHVLAGRHRVQ